MRPDDAELRLEALQLAVGDSGNASGYRPTEEILKRANEFADFVISGKLPEGKMARD